MNYKMKVRLFSVLVVLFFFSSLEAWGRLSNPVFLVPTSEMVIILVELIRAGEIWSHFQTTLVEVAAGFGLAVISGILLGIPLGLSDYLNDVLDPYLIAYYSIPFFAFYPLFITIFGIGRVPIIIVTWLYAQIAIAVNVASGVRAVSETHINVGRSFNLSRSEIIKEIYIPSAIPYVFTGFRLGFVFAMIGAIASEFILSDSGLGYLVAYNHDAFFTGQMYAVILFIAILAVIISFSLIKIEDKIHHTSGEGA